MGEPFSAIGFNVTDRDSYQGLAEEAHRRGTGSRVKRDHGTMHGYCWSVGGGVEIWTVLYETREGIFYSDCRPAFRAKHLFSLYPWEIIEYEEDGEAVARGVSANGGMEILFELQNITEINPADYRERPITVALAGLAYRAQINQRAGQPTFLPLEKVYPRRKVLENDYAVRGRILSWREVRNPHTTSDLIVIDVDAEKIRIEVVANRAELKGKLVRGAWLSAEVWLQGHILTDREMEMRYEGIDREVSPDLMWRKFRRDH
ncbi:MAG: DUF3881 family protein [Blastocatellia bacterium]